PASPRPTTSTTKSGDRERVLIVARGASAAQRLARLPAVVGPAVSILVRPGSPPPGIPAGAHLVPETTNRPRLAQRLRLRGGLLVARLRGTEAVASARARRQRRAVAVRRAWRGRGVGAVIGVGTGSRAKAEAAPPTWLVAADAGDVQPILDAGLGAALAPGSLRWLADRCDENDGPMAP
ncbi:MAG TPA: hypothetical protein VFW92_08230, partial [Candidatus Limnocylindrales bacterium]|nr:hypothetical protein [Candidatus Limnocylindrales bacterium]